MLDKLFSNIKSSRKQKSFLLGGLLVISFFISNTVSINVSAATTVPVLVYPFDGQVITGGRNFVFNWDPCSDAGGPAINYAIEVSTDPNFLTTEFYEETDMSSEYYYFGTHMIDDGFYYWKVRAEGFFEGWSDWSETWNFTLAEIPPLPPILISPALDASLNTERPDFNWEVSLQDISDPYHGQYPGSYNIQISNSSDFSFLHIDSETLTNNYTSEIDLSDGEFWWRVRPIGTLGTIGSWSSARNFTVDTENPIVPNLISPSLNYITSNQEISLIWEAVSDASYYHVQVSNSESFSPNFYNETTISTNYTIPEILSDDTYYWHVRSIDEATNVGGWSTIGDFTIDTTPPELSVILVTPPNPTERDEIVLYCRASDEGGMGYVYLIYRDNLTIYWSGKSADLYMDDIYNVTIGPFASGLTIEYYFSVFDLVGLNTNGTREEVETGSYSDIMPWETSSTSETGYTMFSICLLISGIFIVLTVIRISKRKKLSSKEIY